jgi:Ricin-type beta-trefoil lectin domain-like
LIIDLGGGAYRVRNKKSGKYLGVVGAATTSGAATEQRTSTTGDEQIWLFVPSS